MSAALRASTRRLTSPWTAFRDRGEAPGRNRLRVLLLASVAVVALTTTASWGTLTAIEQRARVDAGVDLQARVGTIHAIFDQWAASERRMAAGLGHSADIQSATAELLALPPTPGRLLASPATAELRERVQPVLDAHGYLGFFVIDRRNISRASSRDENTGTANLIGTNQPERLERIFAGESLLMAPQFSDVPLAGADGQVHFDVPTMFAVAPIPGLDGTVEAALALRIDVANTLVPMLANSAWGATGEVLAVDADGAMLNKSRFQEELLAMGLTGSAFKAVELRDPGTDLLDSSDPIPIRAVRHNWPLTTMADSVTSHLDGVDIDGYRSYLGRRVVGAWEWSDDLGFGLAVEQGEDEALALARYARLVIAAISAIGLILGLLMAWFHLWVRPRLHRSSQVVADQLARLRTMIDRSSDGVLVVDGDDRVVQANTSACHLFGADESELVSRPLDLILPPPGPGDGTSELKEALGLEGQTLVEDDRRLVRASRTDRSTFPAEVHRIEIGDDDHPVGVISVRSLDSDPKAIRLAQTRRDLRRLATSASWAAEGPFETVGVSLAALRSSLASLREEVGDGPGLRPTGDALAHLDRIEDAVDTIRAGNEHLRHDMIASPNPITTGPVDLNDLVAGVVDDVTATTLTDHDHPPEFALGDLPRVMGDVSKLRLLFAGLIDNAVKHGRPGVPVRVEVRAEPPDEPGGGHRIAVADNGRGFDPSRAGQILETFTPPALSRPQVGLGMGLAFCRQVAESHGGSLRASGTPGQGATFVVELPAVEETSVRGGSRSAANHNRSRAGGAAVAAGGSARVVG